MSFVLAVLFLLSLPFLLFGVWVLFDMDGSRRDKKFEEYLGRQNLLAIEQQQRQREQEMAQDGRWIERGGEKYTLSEWNALYEKAEQDAIDVTEEIILYEEFLAEAKQNRDKYRRMYGSGGDYNRLVKEYQERLIYLNQRLDSLVPNPYELS